MRFPGMVIVLGLLSGAGCKPGESARVKACQAELAQKEERIFLLLGKLERERAELQTISISAQQRGLSGDTELFAREARIHDLQRQLDYSNTAALAGEVRARDALENQRKMFQEKVEGLQERIAELERKLAGKN